MHTNDPANPIAAQGKSPIADALVVVLSPEVGLDRWHRSGVIAREWAIYEHTAASWGAIIVVSDGPQPDAECLRNAPTGQTPLHVVANPQRLERSAWLASLPEALLEAIGDARRVVIKSNQYSASDATLATVQILRKHCDVTALIARGGYLWSRFESEANGPDSKIASEVASREGELLRTADLVVGTTPAMLDDAAWRYGLEPTRLRVVPNFTLDELPRVPQADREPATVLVAGQLVDRKRVDVVIQAIRELSETTPCRLEIVGDGPLRQELEELASELGVDARFTGTLAHHDLLERMRRCTIFVQMALREGHPKTVLEAMAAGATVVVADAPGLSEHIDHGVTGLVVPADHRALAHVLGPLLEDESWRDALGNAAMLRIRGQCALQVVARLELANAREALKLAAQQGREQAVTPVRWSPELLTEAPERAVDAWRNSLHGYAKRLDPQHAARFLATLDGWVYSMQGEAAIKADPDGLHPKHRLTRYHDFFVEQLQGAQRVIDLGSGVGALACSIASRTGAEVFGQEIDPATLDKAVNLAHAQGLADRCTFALGDITTNRIPGEFDAIVLSNVLEHLPNRPELLRKWIEWYRPERVVIRVPSYDREWRVPWKDELGVDSRLDHTHEIEFTREQLDAELLEAGLHTRELVHRWGEYWLIATPKPQTQSEAA